jgi:hypothetical protein
MPIVACPLGRLFCAIPATSSNDGRDRTRDFKISVVSTEIVTTGPSAIASLILRRANAKTTSAALSRSSVELVTVRSRSLSSLVTSRSSTERPSNAMSSNLCQKPVRTATMYSSVRARTETMLMLTKRRILW